MPQHDPEDADRAPARDRRTGSSAAAARARDQVSWVDQQIRQATSAQRLRRRVRARGDFDDLPGVGKPLDLGSGDDPDWWLRKLVERERRTARQSGRAS